LKLRPSIAGSRVPTAGASKYRQRVGGNPGVHARRTGSTPIDIVGVQLDVFRDAVVPPLRRPATAGKLPALEEIESIRAPGIANAADFRHHLQTEEKIVMPVQRIVQSDEFLFNHGAIRLALVKTARQEDFGCVFGCVERLSVAEARPVEMKPAQAVNRVNECRLRRRRLLVAVPTAVGPSPVQEPFDQIVNPLAFQTQPEQKVQRIALLRRTSPMPPLHDRNTTLLVGVRLPGDFELRVELAIEPEIQNLLPHGHQRLVPFWVAEIGKRRKNPVSALPLVVHATASDEPTFLVPMCEQGADPSGVTNLL